MQRQRALRENSISLTRAHTSLAARRDDNRRRELLSILPGRRLHKTWCESAQAKPLGKVLKSGRVAAAAATVHPNVRPTDRERLHIDSRQAAFPQSGLSSPQMAAGETQKREQKSAAAAHNLFMKCVRVTFYVTKYFGRNKFAITAARIRKHALSVIFNIAKSL